MVILCHTVLERSRLMRKLLGAGDDGKESSCLSIFLQETTGYESGEFCAGQGFMLGVGRVESWLPYINPNFNLGRFA